MHSTEHRGRLLRVELDSGELRTEALDEATSRWGEPRKDLLRIYNLREGFTVVDDCLPDRFFDEAIDVGRFSGARLGRTSFRAAIDLYYASMGWDTAGVPTIATRYDHHLEWSLLADGRTG